MRSALHLLGFMLAFSNLIVTLTTSLSSSNGSVLCQDRERSALWQFKQSVSLLDPSASLESPARPKLASWKLQVEECCSWYGVECNERTGHVIGLDLSSSSLYGSINSSSSLFDLVHLRKLNLADNNFNYSEIPSAVVRLSKLSHLNLSSSTFSGLVPFEISELSNLVSLDLSLGYYDHASPKHLLKLEARTLISLVQKLTNLNKLFLESVDINSTVPEAMANMSSLTHLHLAGSRLYGEFPSSIFMLPNLQEIDLDDNGDLTGHLPDFHGGSALQLLHIAYTGFSGSLQASLANLTQITELRLGNNNIRGGDLSWISKLPRMQRLYLVDMNLQGEFPSSLANLTQLTKLQLAKNSFTGSVPDWLFNFTQLTMLDLSYNGFQGSIPSFLSELREMEILPLQGNNFSGTVEENLFLNLRKLNVLNLSGNRLSLIVDNATTNATVPKFKLLALGSCNLRQFPDFLQFQDELQILSLPYNKIDHMPIWMGNRNKTTLDIALHHPVLPWANLRILDLRSTMLQGPLPIPPPDIAVYFLSNNTITGEIPHMICSLTSLYIVDFSNNKMDGDIPPCLGNFSDSLIILNLKGNQFQGMIPHTCAQGSNNLKMIDLSQNQLVGRLPISLANCMMLQILDLGSNQIEDTFPSLLEALPELQVLVLSSNKFHGTLSGPLKRSQPSKLQIIDLSNNFFTGYLPLEYFKSWNAMKIVFEGLNYLHLNTWTTAAGMDWSGAYAYSMTITNKGVKTQYEKILTIITALDLSNNKFIGEIPDLIGSLFGLQSINLSHNELTGSIPSSMANLMQVESLDLSTNKLSGNIPQELTQLNFLAFLNVSNNNLTGPIPQGKQFNTFQKSSYAGNLALCGEPISPSCGKHEAPTNPPPTTIGEDIGSKILSTADWIILFTGVGSGIFFGLRLGMNITRRYHEWFVEMFGKSPRKWQSIRPLWSGNRKNNT